MEHIKELRPLPVIGGLLPGWTRRLGPEVPISTVDRTHDIILTSVQDLSTGDFSGLLARRVSGGEIMLAIFGDATYISLGVISGSQINNDPRTKGRLRFFN